MVIDFKVGDIIRLKKPHPCGGYTWRVIRIGHDIGLECLTCKRYLLLPRAEVERRCRGLGEAA